MLVIEELDLFKVVQRDSARLEMRVQFKKREQGHSSALLGPNNENFWSQTTEFVLINGPNGQVSLVIARILFEHTMKDKVRQGQVRYDIMG